LTFGSERYFSGLGYLDLSQNMIESIDKDAFKFSSRLLSIDLGFNFLSELPSSVFRWLVYLKRLILASNRLSYLTNDIFNDLTDLLELDLSQNLLLLLDDSVFSGTKMLRELRLERNLELRLNSNWSSPILGLTSIRNLYISSNIFYRNMNKSELISENLKKLRESLKPRVFKSILFSKVDYLLSINIIMVDNWEELTDLDCGSVMFFFRYKLHFNVKTSGQFQKFLLECFNIT
jgi:Leucine-rich repeat (LRR) protein